MKKIKKFIQKVFHKNFFKLIHMFIYYKSDFSKISYSILKLSNGKIKYNSRAKPEK